MKEAQAILKQFFGHDTFRGGQEQAVNALLAGRDVLLVMPTGAGKSLCYQVPALMLPGITLVISPLVSLMKDQVRALNACGVRAAYINSSLTSAQIDRAFANAAQGMYKIIYVAPERLDTAGFLRFTQRVSISLVAVDEAHCVSQWGQDFRPSYLGIEAFVKTLPVRPPIGAFTATATQAVREDINVLLKLNNPEWIVTGFDRTNLHFQVRKPQDKFAALLAIEAERRYESGIVYCQTRKTVEEVTKRLVFNGIEATRYHAGLSDEERQTNQDDFIYDRKHVMVATNAFGMGIDKSNVSYVVHYQMPLNLESYYQEAGRAGRDGEKADCILLYNGSDIYSARYLITHSGRPEAMDDVMAAALTKQDMARLNQMIAYCQRCECLREYILCYFGEKSAGACGNCGNCQQHDVSEDVTEAALCVAGLISQLDDAHRRFGKGMLIDILKGSKTERVKTLKLDTLPLFGTLNAASRHFIMLLMEEMLNRRMLEVYGDQYPVIRLTEAGRALLKAPSAIWMKAPEEEQKPSPKAVANSIDGQLFMCLKKLRYEIAGKIGMPAYVVFTDATLADMAQKRPATLDAFSMVSGVGRIKTEKYGYLFIKAIKDFVDG